MVLNISFNLTLDAIYKYNRFFKSLQKKVFKHVLIMKIGPTLFNLSFMLLPAKFDLFSKKKYYKKYEYQIFCTGHLKIIPILTNKIVTSYIQINII